MKRREIIKGISLLPFGGVVLAEMIPNGPAIAGKTPLNQTYDIEAANHGFEVKVDYDKPFGQQKSTLDFCSSHYY